MGKITKILEVPWIAHLIRAAGRFSARLSSAFSAAITYYAILASVPILLFAFSILGLVLTVLRPDLLVVVQDAINQTLAGSDLAPKVMQVVNNALRDWQASMMVGIFTVFLSGTSLIATMKTGVQAQMRESFDPDAPAPAWYWEMLRNFGILICFLVLFFATNVFSYAGSSFASVIISFLGFPGAGILLRISTLVIAILMGCLMFWTMLALFNGRVAFSKKYLQGSFMGGTLLALALFFAGYLIAQFSSNVTASIFGPIITIMLLLNVFAQLILFVSAWIATYDPPVEVQAELEISEPEFAQISPPRKTYRIWGNGFLVGFGSMLGLHIASFFRRRKVAKMTEKAEVKNKK